MSGEPASTTGSQQTPPEDDPVQSPRTAERPPDEPGGHRGGHPGECPPEHAAEQVELPTSPVRQLEIAFADWMASVARRAHTLDLPDIPLPISALAPPRQSNEDYRRPGGRPALGIPGIWETWRMIEPWGKALHDAGYDVHLLPQLDAMSAPIDELAHTVSTYVGALGLQDVVLFGHSKGGLVSKAVMGGPEGWRIAGLLAFATPWDGAPIAGLVPADSTRELLPDSPTIARLAADTATNARIVQIEATWDQNVPHVVLEGAQHMTLPLLGHSTMLDSEDVAQLLVELAGQVPRAATVTKSTTTSHRKS